MKTIPIGELLKEQGLITEEQLQQALDNQKKDRSKRLGQHLIDLGFVTEQQSLEALSLKLNIPFVDLNTIKIDMDAFEKIPQALAQKYNAIAIALNDDILTVVTSDPMNYYGFEDLRLVTGYNVIIYVAIQESIRNAIISNYASIQAKSAAKIANLETALVETDDFLLDDADDETPVVNLLNSILINGYSNGVSDIHIEPYENVTVIKIRIDGTLIESMRLDKSIHNALVVRTKILANMDISEKRIPQDGHFVTVINNTNINLRVSMIPAIHGEKIVMRYLNSNTEVSNINTFGMSQKHYEKMVEMMNFPNGIIYVTGPTGSGKTTTLYMIMERLSRNSANVITIEDPVERQLENINQVQVNNAVGLTFESGLRSILRQDPDIIMVGETRDSETASISVRAAITGHLVVSTLHTNNAVSSIVRLADMGIEPYLIANSLIGIAAQRLVKKLCPHCTKKRNVTEIEKELLIEPLTEVYDAVGCPACNNTGYKGRHAIHEIISIDNEIRKMITNQASSDKILDYIKENQDYTSLFEETFKLVKDGITSIDELVKISYYER